MQNSKMISIDGANIFVTESGSGEPVLFLHGVPDSADVWRDVIPTVAQDKRCIAIDLPGFHRSEVPHSFQYNLTHYGVFINQVLEALDIDDPITLVLHDWGGIFGLSFACQFPDKVKRIAGGSFPFSHLYKWHAWARVWQMPIIGELSMLCMNHRLFSMEMKRGSERLTQDDIDDAYYGKVTQKRTRNVVLKLYRSATPRKFLAFQSRLEKLARTVPIDLVWGQEDKYVPPHIADLSHAKTKKLVPGVGHWVPLEAPEEVCAVLQASC